MAQTTTPQLPQLNARLVFLATLVVVGVAMLFWLLFRFYQTILILFVAIVIGTGIKPIVEWLYDRGVPRSVGIGIVYTLFLFLIGAFIYGGAPLIVNQLATIASALPDVYTQIRNTMLSAPNLFIWRMAIELPANLPFLAQQIEAATTTAEPSATITQVWEYVRQGAYAIFGVIVTLVLAFYWTLDGERTKRALVLLIPLDRREDARELVNSIEQKVGNFIIGQALLCLSIGTMALIAYLLIGLPYAFILALFAGIMEAVPVVGPLIGAVPAIIIAFTVGPSHVLWVVIASIIIQQLENSLLVPRIMKRAVGVNPLVTLMALLAFSSLFGLVGAVIAIPIAAIIQLLIERFLLRPAPPEQNANNGRDRLSVLRYQTQELVRDVRKQVREKEMVANADHDQVEDSLEAIAMDLDSLLAQGDSSEATR